MRPTTIKSVKDTHLIVGTLILFLLTLFSLQTIILGGILVYLSYKVLIRVAKQQLKRLSKYLPEHMQEQLQHRNMFQVLNQFWFMQWITILKIFLISFMYQMQPDHVIELISQSQPEFRQKLLGKKPYIIQAQANDKEIVMVQQKKQLKQQQQFKKEQQNESQPPKIIEKMLSQSSSTEQTVYKKQKKPSFILQKKFEDQISSNDNNLNAQNQKQRYSASISRKNGNKQGGKDFFRQLQKKITITKNLIGFTKSAFQLSVVSYKVRRAPKSTLIKIAILFWLALVIQIKINPRARKLLFKAMLIVSGVLTILGATVATGILMYRVLSVSPQKNERNELQSSK